MYRKNRKEVANDTAEQWEYSWRKHAFLKSLALNDYWAALVECPRETLNGTLSIGQVSTPS